MTTHPPIPAVRLNHAVLFVADLERSVDFYTSVVRDGGRRARAPCQRGLPAPDARCQPPRPRPLRHRRRPGQAARGIGLYHLAWQVDTIEQLEAARTTLANADAYTGRVQPRRHQERLRQGPGRQRVRGDVDAAPRRVGPLRARGPRRAPRPGRRGRQLVRASARPVASSSTRTPTTRAHGEHRVRRTGRRLGRRHRRPGRAARRAAARSRVPRAGHPRARRPPAGRTRRTPRCARRSPRAAATRGSPTAGSAARSPTA